MALLTGGCKGGTKSKEDLLEKGQIYINLRQFTQAIEQYDAVIKMDPFDAKAYLQKGKCYKELGNFKEALAAFQKGYVLDTNPIPFIQAIAEAQFFMQEYDACLETLKKLPGEGKNDPFALNLTGKVSAARGDMTEAEKYIRRAVEEDPDSPALSKDLVILLISKKEMEKALVAAREFLNGKNPNDHLEISYVCFDLLLALHKEEDALAFIQTLQQRNPKNPDVLFRLGQYYFAKEDYASALKYADQALALSPAHLDSQILKGTLLLREGKGKEALIVWQALAKNYPNVPDVQFKLALAFEMDGQYEQAKTAYQRLNQMVPDFIPGQLALARIYFRDGWHAEVKKICDKILEKNPDNVDALKIVAASLLAQRNFAEAIPIYQRILSLEPELEKNHSLMAELYLANGNLAGAFQEAQEALKQTPDDLRMMLVAALSLRYQGMIPQAIEILQAMLKKDPEYLPARFNLAELYAAQKLWAPAEEQYQAILEKQPENMTALLNLGKLYFMRGEKEKAESYFLELMKKYPNESELSFELGRLYADQKRVSEAIEKFKVVVEKSPKHILGNLLLANLYRQNGELEQAEKILRQMMKESASINLDNDLALLLLAQGKEVEAIDAIKSLTVIEQQRSPLLVTRGFANLIRGEAEEAQAYFRRVQESISFDLVFALAVAQTHLILGNKEKAREVFLSQAGDFSELDGWYQEWMRSLDKNPSVRVSLLKTFHRYLLFSYYQWISQAEEERKNLEKLTSPLPLFELVHIRIVQDIQDWDKALSLIDALLEREPKSAYLQFMRAQVLWKKGEQNSSLQSYSEALKLNPNALLVRLGFCNRLSSMEA